MSVAPISLKGRALRLLSAREHSRSELEHKLTRFEKLPGALATALDELQAKGFIDEQRVLESVIHRRSAKLGVARIKQELQAKGLEPQAVAEAVADLRATELVRARAIWRKKFGTPPAEAKERASQIRFLASRGFSGEVIRRVVAGSSDEDFADED